MIDVKQAAASAETFVRSLYPETELHGLRIEEVDRSEDDSAWEITLGWRDPDPPPVTVLFNPNQSSPRVFKTLRVDGATGQVASMKIRSLR